jgi:hypothetical protein
MSRDSLESADMTDRSVWSTRHRISEFGAVRGYSIAPNLQPMGANQVKVIPQLKHIQWIDNAVVVLAWTQVGRGHDGHFIAASYD